MNDKTDEELENLHEEARETVTLRKAETFKRRWTEHYISKLMEEEKIHVPSVLHEQSFEEVLRGALGQIDTLEGTGFVKLTKQRKLIEGFLTKT